MLDKLKHFYQSGAMNRVELQGALSRLTSAALHNAANARAIAERTYWQTVAAEAQAAAENFDKWRRS